MRQCRSDYADPDAVLKLGYETGISEASLPKLMGLSRMLDDRLNRPPYAQAPYVGEAAFAHKGGLHASAAQKTRAPTNMCRLKRSVIRASIWSPTRQASPT